MEMYRNHLLLLCFSHSHHLEDWEQWSLSYFTKDKKLDYWKLYDSTFKKYLYVNDYGDLLTDGTSWNDDCMYWTRAGHGCIENKGSGECTLASS